MILAMNSFAQEASPARTEKGPMTYPKTAKGDVVDAYHGTEVPDPYRWLEDDRAAATQEWVKAQNKVTFEYLESIPQRKAIGDRVRSLWNYERFGLPVQREGVLLFSHNTGLQNQAVLKIQDAQSPEGRVLLDPNAMAKDGSVSLSSYALSDDAKWLAYGTHKAGSDWVEFCVRNVATGADTPDLVEWVKFSGASWKKDGSGFFYSRFDAPAPDQLLTAKNEYQKLYFHRMGTPQSEDVLVYERKDQPSWGFYGAVTDDGAYLIIHVSDGTDPRNRTYYLNLSEPGAKVVELLTDFDAAYDFLANEGPIFYFRTDLKASRYRVIAIDTRAPERTNWKEIIPERPEKLEGVSVVGDLLFCEYLRDASSAVSIHRLDGTPAGEVRLPGIGSVSHFPGQRGDTSTHYSFTAFTEPSAIYQYDLASGTSTLWKRPKLDFDGSAYETKQVFFASKDGTRVPMFIVHKKGLVLDGSAPTLLYGYGGFDQSLTPSFSALRAVWLELGGVAVVVNLRGGGEYGAEWHRAGTKLRKQNVFDDFIAAAEHLIREKYTSTPRLAIMGGSNGGLLVGACMTQRPDLFGAALPAVGVMDMLRFHKFTIGWAWTSDYGSSDDAAEFKALYAYSPYHNLKPGTRYPACLVTTADHDDRVVPAHSFKFAARLQECQAEGGPPTLIRIETSAGHGGGTALEKVIAETTDELAFLVKTLGM